MILPGGKYHIYLATRPVDFRNYAGRMIMRSVGGLLMTAKGLAHIISCVGRYRAKGKLSSRRG